MTRTEEDLLISLENRVRALSETVEDFAREITLLMMQRDFLQSAVELLSLPRVTDADIALVRDGLKVLMADKERVM